jgi:hypothetical protein
MTNPTVVRARNQASVARKKESNPASAWGSRVRNAERSPKTENLGPRSAQRGRILLRLDHGKAS